MRRLSLSALVPTARVANGRVAVVAVSLAGIPSMITVIRGGRDASAGVVILVLVAAVSVAFAVDDPAANLLSSKPFPSACRRSLRFVVVGLAAAAASATFLALVAVGPGLPEDLAALVAPATAASCVATAAALVASRREERGSGSTGAIIGLLTVAVTAALAFRWPGVFPTILEGPVHERWWAIAAAGAAGAWWAGRDPAAS
jgi:hypothetical protein